MTNQEAFANKVVWITGASAGIGEEMAVAFARSGSKLVLSARNSEQLERVEKRCYEAGADRESVLVMPLDVVDLDAMPGAVDKVMEAYSRIDVLINNAGVSHASASWKLTADELHRLMEVNFYSAVRCTQLALQGMRAKGFGRIISVSSVVAHKPAFGTSAYTASKSALEGYMRGVAIDVATKGITANTIAYGYMNAGMLNDVPSPILEAIKQGIPQEQFGRPEQIADAIRYLIESEYTTGQTLHLNGGQWMP
ncbi:MAG: SDR family oxidoreductase [Porticoccaceae bacterium]|nr:SDR family oxidoreductase [Porticoccaceae bacterium]